MERPDPSEYNEYYHRYVSLLPDGDIVQILTKQLDEVIGTLSGLDDEKAGYRYAEGKWSVKEVVGHLNDVERVFGYRTMVFARGDESPLPSMEQDDFVAGANFDDRALDDLLEEFTHLRKANIALFRSIDSEVEMRTGMASGFPFTVRAVPSIIAGHVLHHLKVLAERYLD